MAQKKQEPDNSRTHDQRSPAGKFLDGVRGFVDELKQPARKALRDAMSGKGKSKEKE